MGRRLHGAFRPLFLWGSVTVDRAAIFVDAGYLFAQGSILVAGKKLRRGETSLDEEKALTFLEALATTLTGLPLLRIYWYDGTNSGPSPVHVSLAYRPNVKVRLGIVNAFGEQKGVDSLIVTDLINLARNRAMSDAILVTGDEDIRVGVQQAQDVGVRVHLVGLEPAQANQSNLLRQEADTLREISKAEVQAFLSYVAPPPQPPAVVAAVASVKAAGGTVTQQLERAADQLALALSKVDADRVANAAGQVPADVDRQLLLAGGAVVQGSLTRDEKRDLRRAFIKACTARK